MPVLKKLMGFLDRVPAFCFAWHSQLLQARPWRKKEFSHRMYRLQQFQQGAGSFLVSQMYTSLRPKLPALLTSSYTVASNGLLIPRNA